MEFNTQPFKIREIDEKNRIIRFDPTRHGKITGSRFYAVLGKDPYTTEFEVACSISRVYSEYEKTKYTEAGDAIEPIIRQYVHDHGHELLDSRMNLSPDDKISVERPVPAKECGYDHFKFDPVFGGMVDGYIRINGKRRAILEIKTASSREKWTDPQGEITCAPENYVLQASLYAELSDLDEIVFAVGFLNDEDYEHPEEWKVADDNFHVVHMLKKDISEEMDTGRRWFQKYIVGGITPEWSDKDSRIIDRLMIRKVDFVPGDLTELIREYAAGRSDLEPVIKERLVGLITGSMRGLEYEQNGITFRIVPADSWNEFDRKYEMTVVRN